MSVRAKSSLQLRNIAVSRRSLRPSYGGFQDRSIHFAILNRAADQHRLTRFPRGACTEASICSSVNDTCSQLRVSDGKSQTYCLGTPDHGGAVEGRPLLSA